MIEDHPDPMGELAQYFVEHMKSLGLVFATAESCTGGLIAATVTDVPGSSAVLDRGFVTYSNDAKAEMVDVDPSVIERQGAVSDAVASAMAEGALEKSNAHVAVAVTGVAGPDGGTDLKPVGLVWFACACEGRPTLVTSHTFENRGRDYIRHQTVMFALQMALQCATDLAQDQADAEDDGAA